MSTNLLLFLLFSTSSFVTDSSSYVDSLLMQADQYFEQNDTTAGFHLLDSALVVSRQQRDLNNQSEVLNNYGYYHYFLGHLNESIKYYRQALSIDQEQLDTVRIVRRLRNIGIAYKVKGFYALALQQYNQALTLAQSIGRSKSIASVSNSLALLYYKMEQYESALIYYQAALEEWALLEDTLRMAYAYNNMGQVYYDLEQYELAITHFEQSRQWKESLNRPASLATTLHNLGDTYLVQDSITLAQEYLIVAFQLARTHARQHEAAAISNSLAQLYITTEKYVLARAYLDTVRLLNAEMQSRSIRLEHLKLASQYHEAVGQPTEALAFYQQWAALQDSIYHEERLEVVEMQAAYNLEQEEQARQQAELAAEQAQADGRRQQRLAAIATWVGLLFLGLSLLLYRAYRLYHRTSQENETLVKEQHHRVKNNLNSIASLLRMHARRLDDEQAQQAMAETQLRIQSMELIHRQLYGAEISRLEMATYLDKLVTSVLTSYGSQAQLKLVVDGSFLPVNKAMSVGLITNEVVSNACKYAFVGNTHPELTVTFAQDSANSYQLSIHDNGPGIDLDNPVSTSSFGLTLIRIQADQLRGQYAFKNQSGANFTLTFSVRLEKSRQPSKPRWKNIQFGPGVKINLVRLRWAISRLNPGNWRWGKAE